MAIYTHIDKTPLQTQSQPGFARPIPWVHHCKGSGVDSASELFGVSRPETGLPMNNYRSASISVIIPAHNSQATIERALDSVVQQSVTPFEIIVVDDASTDKTEEVVLTYANKCTHVNVKLEKMPENKGPASARNLGISLANGEWLAFLDSDDWWHPRKLEIQIAACKSTGAVFIGCAFKDNGISNGFEFVSKKKAISKARVVKFNKLVFFNVFSTPSVLVRKDKMLPFDESMNYAEDYDCWLRIALTGEKLIYLPDILVFLDKPSFGHGGLSSHLFNMGIGELLALWKHFSRHRFLIIFSIIFSLLKLSRRILIVTARRIYTG